MPIPESVNQSYAPGTPIASQDLNDVQTWGCVEPWAIFRHASYSFAEDFDTPDIGRVLLGSAYIGKNFSASGTAWALTDDVVNTGCGTVQFTHASAAGDNLLSTSNLAFGQSDLWFTCRLRIPAIGGNGSLVQVGLIEVLTTVSNSLFLSYNPSANGNSHWWLKYGSSAALTSADTGIAPSTSTTYQIVDVVRTSGIISVIFNKAYTAPALQVSPSPFNLDKVQHAIEGNVATSGTTTALVDYYKCWARTAR